MNKISKQLLKIAREIKALDEENSELDIAQKQGKKYILHHKEEGTTLWRIQACKDFVCQGEQIKKGDFGGLISKEENLSHDGNCWLFDNARVCSIAKVYENACAQDDAIITNRSSVYGDAVVFGRAKIKGNAKIHGNAKVYYDVENQEITE